jgi:hypothetical protein
MPTGACGIDCNVCQLRLTGACSSCGPGTSAEAQRKLEAQQRILGGPCPILACASVSRIAFCLRDCTKFPCDHFGAGPYPYSRSFLAMQGRRRQQPPQPYAPDGSHVTVASEYWSRLRNQDLGLVCHRTGFIALAEGQLAFRFLNEDMLVDIGRGCLMRSINGLWQPTEDRLLELATVLYLINVQDVYPLGRDIVGPKDLKEGHFFQGPHELKIAPLLERFGRDAAGFRDAAQRLGGEPVDMAEAGFRLKPFPRIHLYYLLWEGDDEFPPRLSVLFDRSIENVLAGDAIWGLVTRVSTALLRGQV